MQTYIRRAAAALLSITAIACGSAATGASPAPEPVPSHGESSPSAIAAARLDSARLPYTEADIQFMTNMIWHHAQALEMAALAPANASSSAVKTLAARITNGQRDEIATMQRWLRDRNQPAPDPFAAGDHAGHGGPTRGHPMPMAGMLTPQQMAQLRAARGVEFDLLFLRYMILHHRGATAMVKDLLATYGAGQDETVFRFATDVNVDQQTEIARMQSMLDEMLFEDP